MSIGYMEHNLVNFLDNFYFPAINLSLFMSLISMDPHYFLY
jgi:hypothetical protein